MPGGDRGVLLRGRHRECRALSDLVAGVHTGQSAVLVLRGEPGVGKTALLEFAAQCGAGCRVPGAVLGAEC